MTLKLGYSQERITPALNRPVYLAGFGQNRQATSIHDELYVRALALSLGEISIMVAALDLIGLGRHHCQEIAGRIKAQAPDTRLLIACTHTHHGPDTLGLWGPDATTSGVDTAYIANLKDQVVRTGLGALAQRQSASLRSTSIQVPGVVKNSRDPEILDEELACMQFCHPESSIPLVTWLIFPCHPEVLWEQNPHITSDYVGPLRQAVEAETSAPCLVMVGAIGGMMTPDVKVHSFDEAEQMGHRLARAALQALADVPAIPIDHLDHGRYEYTILMTNPLFQMAMERGLLPNLPSADGMISTEANLLKVGSTWLFCVPGELLPGLGLTFKAELRAAGAENAAIVGLTNDELGYILPPEAFIYPENPFEPGDHYEETMSIGPAAGPRLHAALRSLLA